MLISNELNIDFLRLFEHFKSTLEQEFSAILLDDQSHLPEKVLTPYLFYIYQQEGKLKFPTSKGIYYNQFPLPNYWQISYINGIEIANILHSGQLIGRLLFSNRKSGSLVKQVDWLHQEQVYRSDYYDQFGHRYAQSQYYNGKVSLKVFYDLLGRERIIENNITGKILLRDENGQLLAIFSNRENFFDYFLSQLKNTVQEVHLLNPMNIGRYQVLFPDKRLTLYQSSLEPALSETELKKADKIYALNRTALHAYSSSLFLTPIAINEKNFQPVILILTDTCYLLHLETLVQSLPEYEFHIAAYTLMAPSLMEMEKYENVYLYPASWEEQIDVLKSKATIYLDINQSSGYKDNFTDYIANGMLLMAFSETIYHNEMVAQNLVFTDDKDMIEQLKHLFLHPDEFIRLCHIQNQPFMKKGEKDDALCDGFMDA